VEVTLSGVSTGDIVAGELVDENGTYAYKIVNKQRPVKRLCLFSQQHTFCNQRLWRLTYFTITLFPVDLKWEYPYNITYFYDYFILL